MRTLGTRLAVAFVVSAVMALSTGCTLVATGYSPAIPNTQKLRNAGVSAVKVGAVTQRDGAANRRTISLRGSALESPYEHSYAAYLAEALRQDLALAGVYSQDARIEISGELLKNDLVAGLERGTGDIEARFVVRQDGNTSYDKVKSAHTEWESSFAAATALPRAALEYPELVRKLIGVLFDDPEFINAIARKSP